MIKLVLLIVLASIFGCASKAPEPIKPKTKMVAVTKHPEKGRIVMEVGKEIPTNKFYEIDMAECSKNVFAKGVIIDGEVTTDVKEIEIYLDKANDITIKAVKGHLTHTRTKLSEEDNKIREETDRIIAERWGCMETIGWSGGLEEIPVDEQE